MTKVRYILIDPREQFRDCYRPESELVNDEVYNNSRKVLMKSGKRKDELYSYGHPRTLTRE